MNIQYGLAGVLVDKTAISKVMPAINSLTYRGYLVQDLAQKCSFEEVVYLLLQGKLPNKQELSDLCKLEKAKRNINSRLLDLLKSIPPTAHPMDVVRSAVSYIGIQGELSENDYEKAVELIAMTPVVISIFHRLRKALPVILPDESLSFIENFFAMCLGAVPEPEIIKALNVSLILYAEHSFNASTFAARVITSTNSDIYSAITGAIGALKGELHGGANEAVMHNFIKIKEAKNAEQWILNALAIKQKVMGFGHRVYRKGDSRVPIMKDVFFDIVSLKGGEKWRQMYEILEKVMVEKKNIYPNLDFPTGPTYYLMGFEIDIFTPIFVMSRLSGWSAHIFEQQANNKLIRPSSVYIGEEVRPVPLIANR